ncbi:MAG: UDP-N-acetylmuramoyl-tripeptide--D-alanyl-D-alanine ligase [Proteobacteria bacterium]|nr:UDP-N-acetylmuramoyl-tripeptide--D-alanyl-D-alanine ligase [Pseudomonadota bacterium]
MKCISGSLNTWNAKKLSDALNIPDIHYNFQSSEISIDTRSIKEHDIFLGIKGENFDGGNFVRDALNKGAAICIINNDIKYAKDLQSKILQVPNTTDALNKLAIYKREQIKKNIHAKIIGITGSVGKTTTKIMSALALGVENTCFTYKNLNNHFGMPLFLANCNLGNDFYILEMGMSAPGEIDHLSSIAHPDIAIITNIGSAHLGFFQSKKDIASAKSEIFNHMRRLHSTAILNVDDEYFEYLSSCAKTREIKVVTFGKKDADVYLDNHASKHTLKIKCFDKAVHIKHSNHMHLMSNIMSSLALSAILGIDIQKAADRLSEFKPLQGRGITHELKNNITLIDESYNASLESMRAAISYLSLMSTKKNGRSIVVLGDMKELGVHAERLHIELEADIEKLKIDVVITFGSAMNALYNKIKDKVKCMHLNSIEDIKLSLIQLLSENDSIMIKGSFSMQMYKIVRFLLNTY